MPNVAEINRSDTPAELRRLAVQTKDASESRRLLWITAVLDEISQAEAARIGGMDRQTLRDWAHRFNEQGPAGLKENRRWGNPHRLMKAQLLDFAALVETGPDRAVHGVVRWRRLDPTALVAERFGVEYHECTIGKLLKHLGFSHVSACPRHPKQNGEVVQAFRKTSRARSTPISAAWPVESLSRSGSRTRPASARRTAWFGSRPDAAHDRFSPLTSVTKAPICSVPSARPRALAPASRGASPIPRPCS